MRNHKQSDRVLNLPAGYFGIVLGTIGMGFAWRYASQIWAISHWPGDIMVILAMIIWALLTLAFLSRLVRFPHSVMAEVRHPVMSSFVSLFPATTMLVAIGFVPWYLFEMLQASRDTSVVPFASAFPDPRLFPLPQLNRSLAQVSKTATAMSVIENLPPGNAELRYAIARRYAQQGITVSPDEIVITAGALEALNLSLQAVTAPGDWVVVENPCFYGALQALERLRLKALSIPTDVKEGIDLMALEQALQEYPVKACWLMTNSQNPLGFTLSAEKKARLVALLTHHNVTLIEDDVYSELYFGREKPLPAKAWDRDDTVLHCSSFSKCLVPGFRIGWVAGGSHARQIQRLQLMSTLSTSSPMQLALVDYLSTRRYDAHLRRLRRQLAERKQQAWQTLLRHLPAEVKIHHNDSGYFLWLELPEQLDAGELSAKALEHLISIAPGKMFSTSGAWTRFFRFNTAWHWGEREEQAVKQLGSLIREMLSAKSLV